MQFNVLFCFIKVAWNSKEHINTEWIVRRYIGTHYTFHLRCIWSQTNPITGLSERQTDRQTDRQTEQPNSENPAVPWRTVVARTWTHRRQCAYFYIIYVYDLILLWKTHTQKNMFSHNFKNMDLPFFVSYTHCSDPPFICSQCACEYCRLHV